MKFVTNKQVYMLYALIIFIIVIVLPNSLLCVKTNTILSSRIKREQSIMEAFNDFFREDNFNYNFEMPKEKAKYKNSKIQENDLMSQSRFKAQPEDTNSEDLDSDSNQMKQKKLESYYRNLDQKTFQLESKKRFQFKESSRSRYQNANPNTTIAKKGKKASNSTRSDLNKKLKRKVKKTTEVIFQDWLMISSPNFKNKNKFPPIKIDNELVINIETDEQDFRINHAFGYFEGANKPPSNKFFWFRLSGLNLYYSTSKCDLNILGVIGFDNIESLGANSFEQHENSQILCFKITDRQSEIWKLCARDHNQAKFLYCQLAILLRKNDPLCGLGQETANGNSTPKFIIQPMIIIPKPGRHCNQGWNYKNKGDDWECECKEGKEQSPIDLPKAEEAIDSPVAPLFNYFKVQPTAEETTLDGLLSQGKNIKLRIFENALKVMHPNLGRIITVDGSIYKAEEIIIHTPSEHRIAGKKYSAEIQVIHYGVTKGDIAKQIMLSFLFEETPGEYNKFFDSIDSFNLPNVVTKMKSLWNELYIPDVFYSTEDTEEVTGTKKFSFYTYQGSLTAPPCTENTIVYVASKPIPLSSTTIKLLQEAIRIPDRKDENDVIYSADILPENDRKIQNRNGRPVFYFDHEKYCGPDAPKEKKENGHFEKVQVKKDEVFYVPDKKPSGFPEAFVISENEANGIDMLKKLIS